MELDRRLVVSSHSGGGGSLLGSEALFEQALRVLGGSRIAGGVRWVGGGPTFVRNPLIPGFEPTGVGSNGPGLFREPNFVERLGRFMARLHAAGGFGSVQFVQQGGMPSAPSNTLSGYADHRIPHALDRRRGAVARARVRRVGRARRRRATPTPSSSMPTTTTSCSGSCRRGRTIAPTATAATSRTGGGCSARSSSRCARTSPADHDRVAALHRRDDRRRPDGRRLPSRCSPRSRPTARSTTSASTSATTGAGSATSSRASTPRPSGHRWPGRRGSATDLPVVYVGRVTSVATAERILADGHADLVGFARAAIADPDLVVKSATAGTRRSARASASRSASTAASSRACRSPAASTRTPAARTRVARRAAAEPRSVLVIGGGPAGTEFAGQMAERGHRVQLWERESALGASSRWLPSCG